MVRAKETAEEQLLRMIEGRGGVAPSPPPLRPFSPERLLEQLRGRLAILWRWALPQPSGQGADEVLWRLHVAERVVWVLLAGLGLYLIIDLLVVNPRPPALVLRTGPATVPEPPGSAGGLVEDRLKPLAAYQQAIVARNPFRFSTNEPPTSQSAQHRLEESTKVLTVVGINRGRVPEALIEDSAQQRTYVVKVGDEMNGLTVKAIDAQGVVVSDGREEIRLQ